MANRTSILIVDDQPDNLRTLAAILQGQGYKVRKAISGAMALETVYSDPPNLILLDIRMPQMDGYEVCAALKAAPNSQGIPIIFLSALSDTADKVKAFSMGGADYITKPFQAEEVLARIGHQLMIQEQRHQLQQEIQERRNAEAMVRQLNLTLEQQIQERTAQLQRSLEFESLLKRITDSVRDSLDEEKILQTVVKEVVIGLNIECCKTEIYPTDVATLSTHEYDRCPFSFMDHITPVDTPTLYQQLLQHQEMQFCERSIPSRRIESDKKTILLCSIFDDYGLLGNLRLYRLPDQVFDHLEIRLVQQVANQCAIAIRQARLYQKAQRQVEELERLNLLKDDFLSTISHELRAPIANIKMVVRLLMTLTNQGQTFLTELTRPPQQDSIIQKDIIQDSTAQNNKVVQYFQVLQSECERELHLIQDLLDLQHLNAGVYPLERSAIVMEEWIPHILEPFLLITQNQQQTLTVIIEPAMPVVVSDRHCLKRVLTELLNNACKYTPPGESILVEVAAQESHLHICVENTGVEIAATESNRIFEKFYRIPSSDPWKHGGTGLGLALVKRMVEYLSGTIFVTSANGQTAFTVTLPLKLAQELPSTPHPDFKITSTDNSTPPLP